MRPHSAIGNQGPQCVTDPATQLSDEPEDFPARSGPRLGSSPMIAALAPCDDPHAQQYSLGQSTLDQSAGNRSWLFATQFATNSVARLGTLGADAAVAGQAGRLQRPLRYDRRPIGPAATEL